VNGSDRDRLRPPPSSTTPMWQPDAVLAKPRAKGEREKVEAGAGADFSALRVHTDKEQASPMLATNASLATGMPALSLGSATLVAAPLAISPNSWSETIDKFVHNSSALTAKHNKTIEALAAEIAARLGLVANGRATIAITGHTDTSGDENYNKDLGLKRADAAKAALELALAKQKLGAGKIAGMTTDSQGETSLAKPTGDDIKEPLNRRVAITVKIEAPPSVVVAPGPSPWPKEEKKLPNPWEYKPPEDHGPRRTPEEDWWKKAEENQRKIDEFDRKNPRKPKSLTDTIVEGVTEALEPIIKKLPKSLQDKAREGIRAGIEKGTESGCDAAIDASGATGPEAEAMKAACKAALKTKPGANK